MDVPPAMPETTPVPTPIVAIPGEPELHVPPPAASVSVVVLPWQTFSMPEIGASGVTVTTAVAVQPAAVVYTIVDVPLVRPLTRPVPKPMVATAVLLLLHVPPGVASASVDVLPAQSERIPVIGEIGLTVTTAVVVHPAAVV